MKKINILLGIFLSLIFNGCMQPSLPTVNEQEVNKYEDNYMKEYE